MSPRTHIVGEAKMESGVQKTNDRAKVGAMAEDNRPPAFSKRPYFFLFLLVESAASAQAWADWRYTKWGMSPEEVLAQSNGDARRVPEGEVSKRFQLLAATL